VTDNEWEVIKKMIDDATKKELHLALQALHRQLSIVRKHVTLLNDPEAEDFYHRMELGLLAPMLKLRTKLDIPYYWPPKGPLQSTEKEKETATK
jgi:hypothetical protein